MSNVWVVKYDSCPEDQNVLVAIFSKAEEAAAHAAYHTELNKRFNILYYIEEWEVDPEYPGS